MELIFWVGMIVFAILGYLVTDEFEKFEGVFGGAFAGFMVSLLIWSIIGASMADGDEQNGNTREYVESKSYLRAFKDGMSTSVKGSFFLGIGTISGGGSIYYGYEDLGNNKYKQIKFDPEKSIIVEDIDSTERPYFVKVYTKLKDSVYKERLKYDRWMMGPYWGEDFKRWEIHIPKGTIVQTFELDLE